MRTLGQQQDAHIFLQEELVGPVPMDIFQANKPSFHR